MQLVQGIPMVQRVHAHCMSTGIPTAIATDDPDLASYMIRMGARVGMTGECATGSDRCADYVRREAIKASIVVNCQCDMPFVPPAYILKAIETLEQSDGAQWATLCAPVRLVAAIRGIPTASFYRVEHRAHIGIYAFKRQTLLLFGSLARSENERERDLEQMRLVDNRIPGALAEVPYMPLEVNTPADLEIANRAA